MDPDWGQPTLIGSPSLVSIYSLLGQGMGEILFFGKIGGWVCPLYYVFLRLYQLSFLKNASVVVVFGSVCPQFWVPSFIFE